MISPFAKRILDWYQSHARRLPWRGHPDPYAVMVAEVMLQQTRVETVIPYFQHWMQRFPTISSLASASQDDVLKQWEGLGYYRRALNLHKIARILVSEYGGAVPGDLKTLRGLPGIGRYTAAAVASMAFGLDEPALDGNVRRVLARVFAVREQLGTSTMEGRLSALAAEHLPPNRAGDYNQALMDLGATICTPREPACEKCPLKDVCQAYALDIVEQIPRRVSRTAVPHIEVSAAAIQRNGRVLIARRPPGGLLGGLWEFPGGKVKPGEDLVDGLKREIREELGVDISVGNRLGVYRHAYTHIRLTLHAFYCAMLEGEPRQLDHTALAWVQPSTLSDYPMGKLDRQIANAIAGHVQEDC